MILSKKYEAFSGCVQVVKGNRDLPLHVGTVGRKTNAAYGDLTLGFLMDMYIAVLFRDRVSWNALKAALPGDVSENYKVFVFSDGLMWDTGFSVGDLHKVLEGDFYWMPFIFQNMV